MRGGHRRSGTGHLRHGHGRSNRMSDSGDERKLKLQVSRKTERAEGSLVSVVPKTRGPPRKSQICQRQELTQASDFRPGFAVAKTDQSRPDLLAWSIVSARSSILYTVRDKADGATQFNG